MQQFYYRKYSNGACKQDALQKKSLDYYYYHYWSISSSVHCLYGYRRCPPQIVPAASITTILLETQIQNVTRAVLLRNDICVHVSTQFLNVDEPATLRDDVEGVCQSVHEPQVTYSRQVWEVASAYSDVLQTFGHV